MKNDLISVVIPVYNNENYFEKCILSVINQTYKNIEIIIINDGSTDNVEQIILKYKNSDSRIIYIKNSENIGVGYSRNKGIDLARGNYIYFLDSDDYIENDTIESLYNSIKPNDTYSCMLAGYKEYDGIRKEVHRKKEELELLKSPSVCMRLFNKTIIDNSHILFSNIKVAEDLEFVFKLLIFNSSTSYIDKQLYTYVIHNESSIRKYSIEQLDTLESIDSIVDYAKNNNKYEEFKEKIEYAAVEHILLGTISRIKSKPNYIESDIKKCINYINNNFINWKENKFVKEYILSDNKKLEFLQELSII